MFCFRSNTLPTGMASKTLQDETGKPSKNCCAKEFKAIDHQTS